MANTESDHSAPNTRRRGPALIAAIHEAVLLETVEAGVAGLTMEGVARRAGTAKTVLYRRWPAPEDILLEAMQNLYPQEMPAPAANDLRGDLIGAMMLFRDFADTPLGQALFAVIAQSGRYPKLHERIWNGVFEARGGRFTATVLHHYADAGKIDPARVTPLSVDIGEAMMIKHLLDKQALPDSAYIERIVDEIILPALGLPAGRP